MKRQLEETQIALEVNTISLQTQQELVAKTRKQSNVTNETYKVDLLVAEENIENLKVRLDAEIKKRQESQSKADKHDELERENIAMRHEVLFLYLFLIFLLFF